MKGVILCDFDGTISSHDVTNRLGELYLGRRYLELEELWERGEISGHECYEREYAALALHKVQIDEVLASIDISPGTDRLLSVARSLGWEFQIISAGFDYYIESLLGRHGLCVRYVANHMEFDGAGKPVLRFLDGGEPGCSRYRQPCSGCKPRHWRAWKAQGYRIAYVGDGSTDFCMADCFAREAEPRDLLFAKDRLLVYCREHGIDAIPFTTLGDVAGALTRDAADCFGEAGSATA